MKHIIKLILLYIGITSPVYYAQPNPFNYNDCTNISAPLIREVSGTNSVSEINGIFSGSKPQLIAIMPKDTMFILPVSGSIPFEVRIYAADADSAADVDSVWFYSRKSSYPNFPFYLTRSSSGFWYMMLQFSSQNREDTYPFVFFAKDKEGNLSDSLVHYVTLRKNLNDVNNATTGIPNGFKLMQNYPNPFNPVTTISYSIFTRSFVTLKIFDLYGKEVAALVSGQKEPGEYSVKYDASDLSSGVYLYTLKAGEFLETRKLLLLK